MGFMNEPLIKEVVLSKGWSEIERVMRKEFEKITVDTNKSINEIGKRYLAKKLAKKHLDDALLRINRVKNREIKKQTIYR